MPEFGKVHIDYSWLLWKGFIICFMIGLLFTPLIFLIIPVLICFYYLIVHEFIHAAAVIKNGGNLNKIHLGLYHCYIDYQMKTVQEERTVYKWGVFADLTVLILLVTYLVIVILLTNNLVLEMWGTMVIVAFTLEGILPKHSDLNEYRKRTLQKV